MDMLSRWLLIKRKLLGSRSHLVEVCFNLATNRKTTSLKASKEEV